ncbi:MAG: hypothetical protein PWP27_787 [Clostridiales bacterium]|jgi:murein DD-endopeptidase MepM/ murein hydrolase activator NlpD|nr:hypothetical protein [Clostridiales bacterium]MDK2932977.1 hypothetical protein [Clostridiales bacterium]
MEGTYRKKRYANYKSRTKNKRNREQDNFIQNVIKQIAVCSIIFLLIFGLKNINSSITNSITNQIKLVLSYTVDVNKVYKSVETFTENIGLMNQEDSKDKYKNKEVSDKKKIENIDVQQNDTSDIQQQKNQLETNDNDTNALEGDLSLEFQDEIPVRVERESIKISDKISVPLEGVITSKFGMRKHPLYQKNLFHYGVDIDGGKNADIVAVMDGEVIEVGYDNNYGKYIRLKHKDDISTFYAHFNEVTVKKGQKVKRNDMIGKVGDSGAALGAHLHFEIWKKDKVLDPMKYIDLPLDSSIDES